LAQASADNRDAMLHHMLGCSTHTWDLRFAKRHNEASFKKSLEPEVLFFGGLMLIISCTLCSFGVGRLYYQEASRQDDPFVWSSADPRTIPLCCGATNAIQTGLAAVIVFARLKYGCFLSWDWEMFMSALGVVIINLLIWGNSWTAVSLRGIDPITVWHEDPQVAGTVLILSVSVGVTASALFVPIRACRLWFAHLLGLVPLLVVISVALPLPAATLPKSLLVSTLVALAFLGAWRHEAHMRKEWMATQEVMEQEIKIEKQSAEIEEQGVEISEYAHGQLAPLPQPCKLKKSKGISMSRFEGHWITKGGTSEAMSNFDNLHIKDDMLEDGKKQAYMLEVRGVGFDQYQMYIEEDFLHLLSDGPEVIYSRAKSSRCTQRRTSRTNSGSSDSSPSSMSCTSSTSSHSRSSSKSSSSSSDGVEMSITMRPLLNGHWEVIDDVPNLSAWLQKFYIANDGSVLLGDGSSSRLQSKRGSILLCGGSLSLQGGSLRRIGSNSSLFFRKVETYQTTSFDSVIGSRLVDCDDPVAIPGMTLSP